jgi:hypothetical protein
MKWFTMFFVLVSVHLAWAGKISLLDQQSTVSKKPAPTQKYSEPVNAKFEGAAGRQDDHDKKYEDMRQFMGQEDERIKAIKILDLDLQRADLELKKRQIEVKLADLNKSNAALSPLTASGFLKPAFKLSGIFMSGSHREALIDVQGANIQAEEGKMIQDGVIVAKINTDSALLKYADGKQETLNLGS